MLYYVTEVLNETSLYVFVYYTKEAEQLAQKYRKLQY